MTLTFFQIPFDAPNAAHLPFGDTGVFPAPPQWLAKACRRRAGWPSTYRKKPVAFPLYAPSDLGTHGPSREDRCAPVRRRLVAGVDSPCVTATRNPRAGQIGGYTYSVAEDRRSVRMPRNTVPQLGSVRGVAAYSTMGDPALVRGDVLNAFHGRAPTAARQKDPARPGQPLLRHLVTSRKWPAGGADRVGARFNAKVLAG